MSDERVNLLTDNLAAFCRAHPREEKILVAPNRIVGRQITDSVTRALAPGGWINLRVETVGGLAQSVAGAEIAAEGRSSLSRAQQLAIIEKVCLDSLGDGSYFAGLRSSPGFHRVLSRVLDELRRNGIDPGSLSAANLESDAKAADLRKLVQAYADELRNGLVDGAGVFRLAVEKLRRHPERFGAWLLVPSHPPLKAAELEFLRLLGADRLVTVASDGPEGPLPGGVVVEFFRAIGEENEIREVFRRAASAKIPFDQIEVLYTDRAKYLPLAFELAAQYEVPATFVDRIDVSHTRPGRAAIGFLDWLTSDFEDSVLRALFRGGSLDIDKLAQTKELSPYAAARILRDARIGWKRDRYRPRLEALREETRSRVFDPDGEDSAEEFERRKLRRLAEIEATKTATIRLLGYAPVDSSNEKISVADLARACASFVQQAAATASELDGVALAALPAVLGDLAFLQGRPEPIAAAASRVRESIADLFVGGSSVTYPRPGHVHFAGFEDGGHTGRPYTFLLGMDASKHPGGGLQDPVLLDNERQRINSAAKPRELALRADVPAERTNALRAALRRTRGRVSISYSCWDLASDREQFPAPELLETYRMATGDAAAEMRALLAASGPPVGFLAAETPIDASEWWLSAIHRGDRRDSEREVLAVYPWLAEGRSARAERESEEFTTRDGFVPSGRAALDPRESREVVSASRLEKMADCPFAYFLRYVLGIHPPEEIKRDPGTWLDPPALGSLLHELYREFMEERKQESAPITLDRDLPRLRELADRAMDSAREQTPSPTPEAFERQRADILRACETFLRSEQEHGSAATPLYFEAAFGLPARKSDCPGAGPEPIEIPAGKGKTLRLRGSIDRIDRAADGTFEIWDYKTGSDFAFRNWLRLDRGRRIQHAIYASAFEALLRRGGNPGRVTRAGYAFPGPRGDGHRDDFGYDPSELEAVLDRLCDVIGGGAFLHSADAKDGCRFCLFESICGGKAFASDLARQKLARARNPSIEPLRALAEEPDGP
jgi:ATP-dependent helicase/nuclease subunit B